MPFGTLRKLLIQIYENSDILKVLTDTKNDMATAEEQREASVRNALEDIAEASGNADAAAEAANTAAAGATTAKQNADAATEAANTAAALANQKATAAQTATDACNTATTNANDATAAANTATTNAVAATEAAVTAKQNADAATAKAEDTAAHPGYVDDDGYYHKWNATIRTYEKTDVSLNGAKGDAFVYGDFTPGQLEALRGPKGDAGYLHIVSHGTADTTYTISANEMHVWGEVTELNISLGANPDQTTVAEYAFKFISGTTATTLTLPIDVKLPVGFVILPKHQYVMTVVFGMLEYWGTAL